MKQSFNPVLTPVLSSERIILRGWQNSDFHPYTTLVSDPVMMRFVGGGAMSYKKARKEFDGMREQWIDRKIGIFVIADKTSNELLGFTGLFESPLLDEPELSWSLSAKNHGKGYASEAAILARNWAFREHNIGPLMSLVHPNNISSKRVAERLGASVESHSTWMGQPRLVYRHITLN
ncbi:MAG: GNAT family N-acetyltransferase [Rhodobacteraceae bacterium]|jgi:RimJ/RimL family protein N-acetyltransferase|nr:GNAT family N-acetyltransferase [Paracoccaceae bacterium]MBT4285577.1 GNAT family N-acetyltransferase [Paracoccaceae bacterium]MBT4777237.1 GNAT family N-acetyltransferase [Paracoccaceae bacterium]